MVRARAARSPTTPPTEGVSSTQILTLVQRRRGALGDVAEPLPAAMRVAEGLPDRAGALAAMHFPRDASDPEAGRGGWPSRSCC